MSREHTPSIDLALSLAIPVPLSADVGLDQADAPSALPPPTSVEHREHRDEYLGPITERIERFPMGEGVWLQVHWLERPQASRSMPKHVRHVELITESSRFPLRRGQIDVLMSAIGLAEYVFDAGVREELARNTC